MASYLSLKMKRKELEEVNDDFSDFSLSSPARKIRRLVLFFSFLSSFPPNFVCFPRKLEGNETLKLNIRFFFSFFFFYLEIRLLVVSFSRTSPFVCFFREKIYGTCFF